MMPRRLYQDDDGTMPRESQTGQQKQVSRVPHTLRFHHGSKGLHMLTTHFPQAILSSWAPNAILALNTTKRAKVNTLHVAHKQLANKMVVCLTYLLLYKVLSVAL